MPAPALSPIGVEPWVERYHASLDRLPGASLSWLERLRAAGIARFAAAGLPTNRDEDWKYSSLRPLSRMPFAGEAGGAVPSLPPPLPGVAHRLVLVNGRLRPDQSTVDGLPDGVILAGLAEALATRPEDIEGRLGVVIGAEQPAMLALNTALMEDGFVLDVPAGVALPGPVEIVFATGDDGPAAAFHPRGVIRLGDGASASVIERHVGGGAHLTNGAVEIMLGEGARLDHAKLQAQGPQSWHLWEHAAVLGRDAQLNGFVLTAGARFSVNRTSVRCAAPGAGCRLDGLYLLRGRQHGDHATRIDHAAPDTSSRQLYKGVVDDQGRAVFQGGVIVREDAQRVDAHQLNRTLLLSDGAEIDTKPMLEIYADDVKCGHGATAGDLDPDQIFYMQARGIPGGTARRLLIEAFLDEVVAGIPAEAARTAAADAVGAWMATELTA